MATLNVCCRLSKRKIDRFQVKVPSLDQDVDSLVQGIENHLDKEEADFDILFCGKVLEKSHSLSSYHLQPNSTVYVVKKFVHTKPESQASEASYTPDKAEVTMAIQSALLNANYRTIVEKMLCDPDTVENIIAAIPDLDKDPSVLAMLQEPELLAVLAHRNNMDSLLQHHPVFAQAAIAIASAVNNEASKTGSRSVAAESLTYSMDQMSDEEDDSPQANGQRVQGPNITASQLAAALQAATGAAGPMPTPSTSQENPGPSGSGTITSDFFQQAMAHAQSASSDAALQQLRDMGITDENVARQALAVTGGDIQAAIDLIFGDELM